MSVAYEKKLSALINEVLNSVSTTTAESPAPAHDLETLAIAVENPLDFLQMSTFTTADLPAAAYTSEPFPTADKHPLSSNHNEHGHKFPHVIQKQ